MSEIVTTRLAELEVVIERGMQTFVEVGQALAEIRDSKLYRESHESFEDYCRERWEFNDSRARQLIAAAETVTTVTVDDLPTPRNERVVRELISLKDGPEQVRAWTQAVEQHGPTPTAKQVHEVVAAVRQETPKPPPEMTYCPTCGHRLRVDQPRPPRSAA